MQLVIMSVGKRSDATVQTLMNDYEKRLSHDFHVQWKYLAASKSNDSLECRNEDSENILKQISPGDQVILLDERGEQKDNEAFAELFQKLASSRGRLVFVIGGAYGVNETMRKRANLIWSLSRLVFPHQLIRLFLIEQIYRTCAIIKNHPYHHS